MRRKRKRRRRRRRRRRSRGSGTAGTPMVPVSCPLAKHQLVVLLTTRPPVISGWHWPLSLRTIGSKTAKMDCHFWGLRAMQCQLLMESLPQLCAIGGQMFFSPLMYFDRLGHRHCANNHAKKQPNFFLITFDALGHQNDFARISDSWKLP